MERVRRAGLPFGLVLMLALALSAGCGGDGNGASGPGDTTASAAGAGQTDTPDEPGRTTEPASDRDAVGGSGGEPGGLPDDWPATFPSPPAGAEFHGYLGASDAARSEYLATYTLADGDLGEVHEYYTQALAAAGWEQPEGLSVVSSVTTMAPFAGDGVEGSVTAQQDRADAPVTITIIVHIQR